VGSTTGNWLVDDFAQSFRDESAVFQWAGLPHPRPAFEPTRSLSSIVTHSTMHGRIGSASRTVSRQVDRLIREYARLLGAPLGEDQVRAISAAAAYREARRPYIDKQVLGILDRLKPAVVLMEDAAYGGEGVLISALKSRGVRVVEPQHGWIGPTHAAYNFGSAMSQPELTSTLPDELLSFGSYWESGIRVPFATTAIGKPHLESMSRTARPWADRPHEVLLVSSVVEPESTIEFGLALADELSSAWRVRLRPHPVERAAAATRYARLLSHPQVSLDHEPDVYDSLGRARGVVGVSSTVLFEALALGCKVFVRDSAQAPYYVGDLFGPLIEGPQSAVAVARGLDEASPTLSQATLESIWKPGAVGNFHAWVDAGLPHG
jgi:hypothetical protein